MVIIQVVGLIYFIFPIIHTARPGGEWEVAGRAQKGIRREA